LGKLESTQSKENSAMSETQIYQGACSKLSIGFNPNVITFDNVEFNFDGERFLIYDSYDETSVLRLTFEVIPVTDTNYDGWLSTAFYTSEQRDFRFTDGNNGEFVFIRQAFSTTAYHQGRYLRRELDSFYEEGVGGSYRESQFYNYFIEQNFTTYDDNGTPVNEVRESQESGPTVYSFGIDSTPEGGNPEHTRRTTANGSKFGARTFNGNIINLDTGELSEGYRLRLYNQAFPEYPAQEWYFTGNPNPFAIRCLNELCRDGCIPLWNSSFTAKICLCDPKETGSQYDEFPNLDQDSRTWKL
jgi:hypothetical protein